MAKTVIPNESGEAKWGEIPHLEASQNKTFTQMIFELLSEREGTPDEIKLFDLMLNLSIDHGTDTPSAVATIQKSGDGGTISESVAAGIEQINERHGGAIEPAMEVLYKAKAGELKMDEFVKSCIDQDIKIAGLGHRIYKDSDPRAELIMERVECIGGSEQFLELERELQKEMEKQSGKHLVINIDGAIAVALCTMNFSAKTGKAFFIIARIPGLCGQFLNATK